MKTKNNWQNWGNLILGAWVFMNPWSVNHNLPNSYMSLAMWNLWILGAVIVICSILALRNLRSWEERTNLVAGVWLVLSPWIFGYANQSGLLWNSVIVGIAVSVLSGLALSITQRRKAPVF